MRNICIRIIHVVSFDYLNFFIDNKTMCQYIECSRIFIRDDFFYESYHSLAMRVQNGKTLYLIFLLTKTVTYDIIDYKISEQYRVIVYIMYNVY